jgi:hypothetical protein
MSVADDAEREGRPRARMQFLERDGPPEREDIPLSATGRPSAKALR